MSELQKELLAQQTFVHLPPRDSCSSPLPPTPAPPTPTPSKCAASAFSTVTVRNAGTAAVNGVYKKTSQQSDGFPIFQFDATHTLYRYGGKWRLGLSGHGLTYENTVPNADGPPQTGWVVAPSGSAPTPTLSCP